MPRRIVVYIGIGSAVLGVIALLTFIGAAPWSPRPAPPAQEVRAPTPAVTAAPSGMPVQTPAKATTVPKQAVGSTLGVTATFATLTKVTTTVWAQECKLNSEKPECDWVLKSSGTETTISGPVTKPVSYMAGVTTTATAAATVTVTPTATATPTVAATATPSPTATPRPAVAAPAPQVAPTPVKESPGPPPPQLEPSYRETGKGQTQVWTLAVGADKVLIVGGYRVDGRGPGVYKAYQGGQTVTVTVTDGFVLIVEAGFAPQQFCFRVGQARQYGWDHSIVEPLPGWPAC